MAKAWGLIIETYVYDREAAGRPVKWYEQPGLARGAHATLLAGRFAKSRWHAAALGDSCLFQVRDEHLVASFPVQTSAGFGIEPDLLNSLHQDSDLVAKRVALAEGTCEQHDQFYFCTDALAAWFLSRGEAGERPWEALRDVGTDVIPRFDIWVAEQRAHGLMRNDDVTLIRVDVW
jgi:hypothetical protein